MAARRLSASRARSSRFWPRAWRAWSWSVSRGSSTRSMTLLALAWTMPVSRFITPICAFLLLVGSNEQCRAARAEGGSVSAMDERLCLLSVHAHPDDEASKGAGTIARYHAEGVHTVLVTCTGGEEGDILNPAMDKPEVRENLAEVRRQELEAAVEIIGYDELVLLGYRDSGMPDTPGNLHPESFAQADLDEAVG